MDIPLQLSGNFGELRPGHFHAGLDIRTSGKLGLNIYAIEEGFVSRIAVSESGYGKVIYITHENGYTSVYAHLRKFNSKLESFAKNIQYANRSFQFDTVLTDSSLTVSKGEIIGFSGNTGGSGGPHLHFEIRNTLTEHPINPLHFNFDIKDQIAPKIYAFAVYPLSTSSHVNGENQKMVIKTVGNGKLYQPQLAKPLVVNGKIGFGVYTRDKISGSPFNFGIYSIELFKNNQLVYKHQLDSLDFENTRSMNAHMDYYEALKNKRKFQRSFILPGNKLSTYSNVINNGEFFFLKDDTVELKYIIRDFHGNESTLQFQVISTSETKQFEAATAPNILAYGESNNYKDSIIKIDFPPTCLYENTPLNIKYDPKVGRCLTPIAHVNTLYEPLNDYMQLSFNIDHIDFNFIDKLVVVSLTAKKQLLAAEGGTINENWITCKTRSFGPYTVFKDIEAPSLVPKNYIANGTYFKNQRLYFQCKDNISGIGKYEAYIDGKWILVEYEKNRKQLFFELDRITKTGKNHQLELVVEDKVGNKRTYESSFNY